MFHGIAGVICLIVLIWAVEKMMKQAVKDAIIEMTQKEEPKPQATGFTGGSDAHRQYVLSELEKRGYS